MRPRLNSCLVLNGPRFHHDPYQDKATYIHETQIENSRELKMAKKKDCLNFLELFEENTLHKI